MRAIATAILAAIFTVLYLASEAMPEKDIGNPGLLAALAAITILATVALIILGR